MDLSKIKKSLPGCELGEIRPCTAPGKVQFHLVVSKDTPGAAGPRTKVIDVKILYNALKADPRFGEVKSSAELGVVKAAYKGADISAMASGRVVVRKAGNEALAQGLLEAIAPALKRSLLPARRQSLKK